jgi:hypothetical protein
MLKAGDKRASNPATNKKSPTLTPIPSPDSITHQDIKIPVNKIYSRNRRNIHFGAFLVKLETTLSITQV